MGSLHPTLLLRSDFNSPYYLGRPYLFGSFYSCSADLEHLPCTTNRLHHWRSGPNSTGS